MTPHRATPAHWTPEQDAILLDMWRARTSFPEIAERFGRTVYSCESRVRKLVYIRMTPEERAAEMAARGRHGFRWSAEEIAIIEANKGTPHCELAALLPGRTPRAVADYFRRVNGNAGADYLAVMAGRDERPFDVPFTTSSGVRAIRCSRYGLVPYVPSLYK